MGCLLLMGCGSSNLPPPCSPGGLVVQQLVLEGVEREFVLHVPTAVDASTPSPLVVDLHGLGTWCSQTAITGSLEMADREGFLVAYPRGVNDQWNAWELPDLADDVTFLRELVALLSRDYAIDPSRIYLLGYSNGAAMAYLLACRAGDVFAAVGAVAGTLSIAPIDCRPSRPIPVMHFHGTDDTNWPYDGLLGLVGAPLNAWDWTDRNGCSWPSAETYRQGAARCETWSGCDGGVEVNLCTVEGMGHCWPGSLCGSGGTVETLGTKATELIWQFFERFSLPGGA